MKYKKCIKTAETGCVNKSRYGALKILLSECFETKVSNTERRYRAAARFAPHGVAPEQVLRPSDSAQ